MSSQNDLVKRAEKAQLAQQTYSFNPGYSGVNSPSAFLALHNENERLKEENQQLKAQIEQLQAAVGAGA